MHILIIFFLSVGKHDGKAVATAEIMGRSPGLCERAGQEIVKKIPNTAYVCVDAGG